MLQYRFRKVGTTSQTRICRPERREGSTRIENRSPTLQLVRLFPNIVPTVFHQRTSDPPLQRRRNDVFSILYHECIADFCFT
ncbi:hypothetical protein BLNAU_15610 [Blattamonas nauphoetae]|uniref:Uncharacterized protein n=1 Tax=Blattamonas nauphoetae TaxID=2049346 RepID=A0ABQ9XDI4_9EUKA|nr:hypothetical protein BLNAU_15610 [Blattamonas nauphoetae]